MDADRSRHALYALVALLCVIVLSSMLLVGLDAR
jgi:hypothetical protein